MAAYLGSWPTKRFFENATLKDRGLITDNLEKEKGEKFFMNLIDSDAPTK